MGSFLMGSQVIKTAGYLKQLAGQYFCTIVALVLCVWVIYAVSQVRYAFDPSGFTATRTGTLVLLSVFLLYYIVSGVGLVCGGWLYHHKFLRRRSGDPQQVDPILRPYVPFVWMVTWPTIFARSASAPVRRVTAVLLGLVGGLAVILYLTQRLPTDAYPLFPLAAVNFGWVTFVLALWLLFVKPTAWSRPGTLPAISQVLGWRVGWLATTYILGEVLWYVATRQLTPWSGYLMYTQWAVLQILVTVLMIAHTLDFLDWRSRFPLRLIGIPVIVLIGLFNLLPEKVPSSLITHPDLVLSDGHEGNELGEPPLWLQQLEQRVDVVPGGPCVIVAASGGGTRAALFTALVLQGMQHEESFDDHHYDEHLVMISGVSGGSLGASQSTFWRHSQFASSTGAESDPHSKNTNVEELRFFIGQALAGELRGLESEETRRKVAGIPEYEELLEERIAGVARRVSEVENSETGAFDGAWILTDPVIDAVCTDFMAPILRGTVTPFISRGEALRLFWDTAFGWQRVTNVTGFNRPSSEGQPPGPAPLVLLNACNTTWGTRFTIGIPYLPNRFFDQTTANANASRFPVRALSDKEPLNEISLSHAVRLSSNFPWGFRVRTLADTNLLDGGMVDNTGIDTIFEVFRRLSTSHDGRRVLAKMARKGVFILEIDSGGKPQGQREQIAQTAGVMEPLTTLKNALHTNAEIVKEHYLHEIEQTLQDALAEDVQKQLEVLAEEEARQLAKDAFYMVAHVPFQCENFSGSPLSPSQHRTVMTAWSLDARQKGQVMARFLIELSLFRSQVSSHQQELQKELQYLAMLEQMVTEHEKVEALAHVEQAADTIERSMVDGSVNVQQAIASMNRGLHKLERTAQSAKFQKMDTVGVDSVLHRDWLKHRRPRHLPPTVRAKDRVEVVQQPTATDLQDLKGEAAAAAKAAQQRRDGLRRKFLAKLHEAKSASSLQKIQQSYENKRALSEQILK